MGAVAGLLAGAGHDVRGSDAAVYPPMSEQLAALGVPVMMPYAAENLAWKPELVVVGNVHGKDHVEVKAAQAQGIPLTSFPAVLGDRLIDGKHSIVVTGTHGKTTTTSLIAHILTEAGRDPSLFVGGVPVGLGQGFRHGQGDFVIEGDEYDTAFFDKGPKFLHYKPQTVILTSVELDHVDIFPSFDAVRDVFKKLVTIIPSDGLLVVCADSADALAVAEHATCRVEQYAVLDNGADGVPPLGVSWWASNLEIGKSGRALFDVHHSTAGGNGERYERFETLLVGRHNVSNCLAAIAVCHARGLTAREIQRGISSFAGVRRRQELRGIAGGVTVLDDYGHHPTAVRETLKALRKRFPKRRLIAVYEPRSATSRRKTFQLEFVDAFAHADEVIVGKLFDPGKIPENDRFDPERLALDLHRSGTKASYTPDVDTIVKQLAESAAPGDVVCVLSSGSFDGLHDKLLDAIGDAMRPAQRADMASVRGVLAAVGLVDEPARDDQVGSFFVLRNERGVVGCVALEVLGDDAILRALAADPEFRGAGYGWMLADMAVSQARWRGVRRIYLITETASDFFAAKFGFRVVDRSTLSKQVASHETFTRPSGAQLVAMRLDL
ncbi:MAG: cytoplasmic peptidoglycan synthetase domain protein [Deltaproteobacteria bacterium]|nr:cytoplasmic peptidoglycan synthetase domain protein [Deltaproteobacteria bacterium]